MIGWFCRSTPSLKARYLCVSNERARGVMFLDRFYSGHGSTLLFSGDCDGGRGFCLPMGQSRAFFFCLFSSDFMHYICDFRGDG